MRYLMIVLMISISYLIILSGCTHKYVMQNCMRVFDKEGKVQTIWVCEN